MPSDVVILETWQLLALRDIERPQPPHLRISAAGHCPLALIFAAAGFDESDPPDQESVNRMALGHMCEILIIKAMKAQGWEMAHTVIDGGQLEVSMPIRVGDVEHLLIGHPDGICRHPEWTRGYWVTFEAKSMSPDRAYEVEQIGITDVYPAYLAQAALYGNILYEIGKVDHPGRAVFGMMDREGRVLSPERVSWESQYVDDLIVKLTDVVQKAIVEKEVIDRPYAPDSDECKICNYFSYCWGSAREYHRKGRPPIVEVRNADDPGVVNAARKWRSTKPEIDDARDQLRAASDSRDKATIQAAGVLAGYFYPKEETAYDPNALEERVPLDILRQCLSREQPPERPAFWIRPDRRNR